MKIGQTRGNGPEIGKLQAKNVARFAFLSTEFKGILMKSATGMCVNKPGVTIRLTKAAKKPGMSKV
jgi:hypothetical protein